MQVQGLYDIYGFWHKPFWQTTWFKSVELFVLFVFALVGAYFLWRFIQSRVVKKTLWQRALEDLAVLQQRNLQDRQVRGVVYVEITRILKSYSAQRYAWPVVGMTDREFMDFLVKKGVDARMVHLFEKIAKGCELVKFAQESVDRERVLADCGLSEDFIRITIPSDQH